MTAGTLTRVVGAMAEAAGLHGVALHELVRVGHGALLGEVLRVSGDVATLQVFEETTGLRVGEPVVREDLPLAIELGPGPARAGHRRHRAAARKAGRHERHVHPARGCATDPGSGGARSRSSPCARPAIASKLETYWAPWPTEVVSSSRCWYRQDGRV